MLIYILSKRRVGLRIEARKQQRIMKLKEVEMI